MTKSLVIISILFATSIASAQNTSSNSSGSSGGTPSSGGFQVSLGLFDSMGSMKNQSGSIASRSMNNIGLYAAPAYSFGSISVLLYADYIVAGQTTDPTEVSNTNLGGSGWVGAPGISFGFSKIDLLAGYILYGNYVASKKTAANEESSYSKPSGYVLQLGYALNPPWKLRFIYRSVGYSKANVGTAFSDIKDDQVVSDSYGLGISATF